MKTSLDHLPEDKIYQLKHATDLIVETVNPGKLILFGSYARGDWVEELAEDGFHYEYQSDFDLVAVVKNEALAKSIERKSSLHSNLRRELRTRTSLIAEDIHHFNRRLIKSQYFYTDIIKEGILLHDDGTLHFAEPKELTPQERKKLAQEDFDYWFKGAQDFFSVYEFAVKSGSYNIAAFQLHQVAEQLYDAFLLVFTHYKPKTHDLSDLGQMVASVEPKLLTVFPKGNPEQKRLFELLRSAYVHARYSKGYTITEAELTYLAERVKYLETLTEKMCKEKIESFV